MTTFAIAFSVYTLAIVAVGLASARFARRSNEDYFLAGRGLGAWIAALSASASSESGWVTLGLVGLGFSDGASGYWVVPGCLLGYAFNWFVIAGRMRARSEALGALTVPDFFAFHFRERTPILRFLTVLVILVAMWMYVAAQFAAAGKAFHSAFGVSYGVGVAIGTAIVVLYTVLGGFRATCWTDAVQALLMVGALAVFPLYLLGRIGGVDFVHEQLGALQRADGSDYFSFLPAATGFAFLGFLLGSGALGINLGFPGQPHVLVRFKALRSPEAARAAGVIALLWGALVLTGAVTVGILVRAASEGGATWTATVGDGDVGLVLAAKELLPGVMSGVVLAAVLAAMCSTADSQLVVAASAGSHDVYARTIAREAGTALGHLLVNRLVVLGLGLGAMLLALDTKIRVYEFVVSYSWAVLGAGIGPQVILALLWRRATYAGCIAGMVTGFAVALIWQHWGRPILGVELYNLTVAFVAALGVNLLVSAFTAPLPPGRAA